MSMLYTNDGKIRGLTKQAESFAICTFQSNYCMELKAPFPLDRCQDEGLATGVVF